MALLGQASATCSSHSCSPTVPVRTLESTGVSFRKSLDEIDCSGAEINLRNNDGSKRLQQAVPNPYSNRELDWTTNRYQLRCEHVMYACVCMPVSTLYNVVCMSYNVYVCVCTCIVINSCGTTRGMYILCWITPEYQAWDTIWQLWQWSISS